MEGRLPLKRLNPMLRLLLGVHLVLAVLMAIAGNINLMRPPHAVFRALLIGLFLGQAVSAGLWTGLANRPTLSRFARGALTAGLIWALGVTSCHGWANGGAKIGLALWLVVPWAAVAMAASFLRRYGVRCIAAGTGAADSPPEGIQFSLRQLAIAIATCAVLLSLVRGLHSAGTALTIASFLLAAGAFAIAFTLQGLACLWAALGAGAWIRRIWLPLLLAVAWAPLSAFAGGSHPQQYLQFGAAGVLCISLVLMSSLAVRSAGYRLVRDPAVYQASANRLETETA